MENNRRSFFKGLATFVSGVAAAKVASYIPKEEEPKEEVLVPSVLTIHHEGKEYHPLVVEKININANYFPDHGFGTSPEGLITTKEYPKPTIRKANI